MGFLERFPLLENVNLSKNQLANIEVIGALRSLFDLNVRENRLTVCPGFVEPLNLRVADFGENDIHTIEGFSEGTPLRQLNLDKNKLTKITGLSTCHLLTELSLADNQITSSDGLEGLTSLKVRGALMSSKSERDNWTYLPLCVTGPRVATQPPYHSRAEHPHRPRAS